MSNSRVALIHDYLTQYGGAERVLEELALLFPNAPIFTLLYDERATGGAFAGRTIYTSFLQKLPGISSWYRLFPVLMPLAIERFDLSAYDIVISSSSSFAKGVLTREDALHICYCHTPTRFAWFDYRKIAGHSLYPRWVSLFVPLFLPYIRLWDRMASARVDVYACNSHYIAEKIKKYYRRTATVIYPPVNTKRFAPEGDGEYFLVVGRLLPYKRFDIAVSACTNLSLPLVVVGSGPELATLKRIAGPTVRFVGNVSDARLADLYAHASALVFPQEEDFGISAIESMASGRPVIAYRAGGAREYVKEGENGIFFEEQTVAGLSNALSRYATTTFDAQRIRQSALAFDRMRFRSAMKALVSTSLREKKK